MKKMRFAMVMAVVLLMCFVMSACDGISFGGNAEKNPADIIKDAYGNEQFRISFSSANLDEPVADITYTSQNMPKLPTPTRVGYIFEGWYFDSDFTVPYIDGILYLYMTDVTLYAKWSKEEFVQFGTYDIEYRATVVGGLKEGVKDITEALISDEIYIEKSNKGLMLRLQYDCGVTAGFGQLNTFLVSSVDSAVGLVDSVDSDTDPVKTLYFNIADIDIAEPIYFSVTANSGGESPDFYTLEFTITRLIGFSRPFANPDYPLENGYYLVNTYFRSTDGSEVMGGNYNPVYSYIVAENGKYTLIKPFIPYTGLVGSGNDPDYLYGRLTSFFPMFCYYDSDEGSAYGDLITEFHADTGRVYNIFDLQSNVKKDLYVTYSVTGMMEIGFGYGTRMVNIDIDYDHMIRVASIDYTPLTGDYYQYGDTLMRYGSASPARSSGMYAEMRENGMTTDMVNFYFTADELTDSDFSSRKQLSHRMTVSASDHAAVPVEDLAYSSTKFSVGCEIYGYDGSEDLYADVFSVGSITNGGLRGTCRIEQGKSLTLGTSVSLSSLYQEKVDPFGDWKQDRVTTELYVMQNGQPDFSSSMEPAETFTFERDVAVRFTVRNDDGSTATTLVELIDAAAHRPVIGFGEHEGVVYREGDAYNYGEYVPLPALRYSWNGTTGEFIGNYYEFGPEVHPLRVEIFSVGEDDTYQRVTTKVILAEDTDAGKVGFRMNYEKIAVVYELKNSYGESELYETVFTLKTPAVAYSVDRDGETVSSGTVMYENGVRRDISLINTDTRILQSESELDAALSERYTLSEDGDRKAMTPWAVYVRNESGERNFGGDGYTEERLFAELKESVTASDYALFVIQYRSGNDGYAQAFSYHCTFDGLFDYKPVDYPDVFTGRTYTFRNAILISRNGTVITDNAYNQVSKKNETNTTGNVTMTSSQGVYTVTFHSAGTYTLTLQSRIFINLDKSLFAVSGFPNFTFSQTMNVLDGYGSGQITYVSTENHPFAAGYDEDGDGRYTVSVNLQDTIRLLSTDAFVSGGATLYGWSLDPDADFRSSGLLSPDYVILDYIGKFNEQNITLYAVWDEKLSLTLAFDDTNSKTFTYSLSSGRYVVSTDVLVMYGGYFAPNGQKLIGFTGGIFGDETVALDDLATQYYVYDDQALTVRAVYGPA